MPLDQVENFVEVNVSGDHSSTETTISLESGEASNLPDPSSGEFNLVWFDSTNFSRPSEDNNVEIVRVTGQDTNNDTITVLRGQENTTAVAHDTSNSDYVMILAYTAKTVEDIDAANFSTNSLTVAGNSVTLGSSTAVDHSDLSNINSGDHHVRYTDEESQDAFGSMLTGQQSLINVTYDDANNEVDFVVQEADIDHDSLTGFVSNEHINHSNVSITAGTHLTGGGNLTASRTLNVDETGIDATNLDGSAGTSGQFLQTDGTNLNFADVPDEVVIQDTEPSSPFEGMWWYDTGSDTMQYYDGTTFVSPASSFDDITITEDSNGDKQVDPTVRGTGWEKLQETQNTSISSGNSLNFSMSSTYDEYYVFAKVDGDGFEKLNVTLNNITSGYTLYSNDGTETTGASQFDQIMRLASEGTEEVVSFRIVNSNTSSVLKSNSTTDREASSLNKGLVKSGEISSIELIVEFGSTMNFKIVEVFGREI